MESLLNTSPILHIVDKINELVNYANSDKELLDGFRNTDNSVYNDTIDKINDIFKQGLMMEHPEKAFELKDFRVNASIKTFTPQDDQSYNSMIGQLKSYGVLSTQTASENTTISANDEFKRIKDETLEENSLRPTII